MVNSGAWTGSRIKGLNSRIKGEHKVKEGNIGIHNAGLIDWLIETRMVKQTISVMSTGSDHWNKLYTRINIELVLNLWFRQEMFFKKIENLEIDEICLRSVKFFQNPGKSA